MLHQTYTHVNSKNLKLDSINLDLNKTFENYKWFSIHAWCLKALNVICNIDLKYEEVPWNSSILLFINLTAWTG